MFASALKKSGPAAVPKAKPRNAERRKQTAQANSEIQSETDGQSSARHVSVDDAPTQPTIPTETRHGPIAAVQVQDHTNVEYENDSVFSSGLTFGEVNGQTVTGSGVAQRQSVGTDITSTAVHDSLTSDATTRAQLRSTTNLTEPPSSQNEEGETGITSPVIRADSEASLAPSDEFTRIARSLDRLTETIRQSGRPHDDPYHRTASTQDTPSEQMAKTIDTRPRKRRKRNAAEEVADIIARAVGNETGSSKQGDESDSDSNGRSAFEIVPSVTTLGDLCGRAAARIGKPSKTERAIAANLAEITRRRKEAQEERLKAAQNRTRKRGGGQIRIEDEPQQEYAQEVIQIGIENGQIVATSREIDRGALLQAQADAVQDDEIREDADIFKRVNQSTLGSKQQIPPGSAWDPVSTAKFYEGLSIFGTDFKMISNMIDGKSRRQVKLKYNVEERDNWLRVKSALSGSSMGKIDLEKYAEEADLKLTTLEEVEKQMQAEEKRLRDEDEQRRREEGIITKKALAADAASGHANGQADVPVASVEVDENAVEDGVSKGTGVPRARTDSTITARASVQPATKKKTIRKAPRKNNRGEEIYIFEGTEERLGAADDVPL